jgi:hypothetical protein
MVNLLAHRGPARLAAGLGVLAMSGVLAGCGGSSAPKAAAMTTDIYGATCPATSAWHGNGQTVCPQNEQKYKRYRQLIAPEPSVSDTPQVTDPDGNTCLSLDQAGYRPGTARETTP